MPVADRTVGDRRRTTVSLTCEAERISRCSRIRLHTYPSWEIRSQAPNNDVAGSIPATSAIWQMLRFLRVEHCHSNRRRLPFIGIKGVGGIVATWRQRSRSLMLRVYYRAPCTCHGDFFKIRDSRDSLAPWPPARTSRTACSLSRAPASASCVEAGASSFFST